MMIELLANKIFLGLFLSLLVSQGIKVGYRVFKLKKFNFWHLFETGGMPSSHSALVFSLVTGVYLSEGLSSVFFISFVLLIIVLRDAVGVRRSVGEEGKILVNVAKRLKVKTTALHIAMGHTPLQVFVGALIGICVTILVFLII